MAAVAWGKGVFFGVPSDAGRAHPGPWLRSHWLAGPQWPSRCAPVCCSLRRRAGPSGPLASLADARGASMAQSLRSGLVFPQTPGAGIRLLGFARIGSRGRQWPSRCAPVWLFPQTPGAGIRLLGFARIGSRGRGWPSRCAPVWCSLRRRAQASACLASLALARGASMGVFVVPSNAGRGHPAAWLRANARRSRGLNGPGVS